MMTRSFGLGASGLALAAALLVAEGAARAQATRKAAASSSRLTAGAPGAKAEFVSLQINKPSPGEESSAMMGGRAMRMHRMDREGTLLTVVVLAPGKTFVAFDAKASKLAAFKDDKGTDLAKAKAATAPSLFGITAEMTGQIDADGRRCTVDIFGPRTPAAGAGKLTLTADLVLKVGASEKSAEQKDLSLKPGSKLTAGPVPMAVEESEGPGFNALASGGEAGPGMTFALSSKRPTTAIKELAFSNPDGTPIKSRVTATMNAGQEDSRTFYTLEKKVEHVGVKVTYYDRIESLTVPVAFEAGVGF